MLCVPLETVLRTYVPLLNLNAFRVKRQILTEMSGPQVAYQLKCPLPNPSNRTMAQESTEPLSEMSTRNLPGG
jgi:hypothetical protein